MSEVIYGILNSNVVIFFESMEEVLQIKCNIRRCISLVHCLGKHFQVQ